MYTCVAAVTCMAFLGYFEMVPALMTYTCTTKSPIKLQNLHSLARTCVYKRM